MAAKPFLNLSPGMGFPGDAVAAHGARVKVPEDSGDSGASE